MIGEYTDALDNTSCAGIESAMWNQEGVYNFQRKKKEKCQERALGLYMGVNSLTQLSSSSRGRDENCQRVFPQQSAQMPWSETGE